MSRLTTSQGLHSPTTHGSPSGSHEQQLTQAPPSTLQGCADRCIEAIAGTSWGSTQQEQVRSTFELIVNDLVERRKTTFRLRSGEQPDESFEHQARNSSPEYHERVILFEAAEQLASDLTYRCCAMQIAELNHAVDELLAGISNLAINSRITATKLSSSVNERFAKRANSCEMSPLDLVLEVALVAPRIYGQFRDICQDNEALDAAIAKPLTQEDVMTTSSSIQVFLGTPTRRSFADAFNQVKSEIHSLIFPQ
jgi:hypothetical protein